MYQDVYLDLCEMRRYVALHSCKLVIGLGSELCGSRTLFPAIQVEVHCMATLRFEFPYLELRSYLHPLYRSIAPVVWPFSTIFLLST